MAVLFCVLCEQLLLDRKDQCIKGLKDKVRTHVYLSHIAIDIYIHSLSPPIPPPPVAISLFLTTLPLLCSCLCVYEQVAKSEAHVTRLLSLQSKAREAPAANVTSRNARSGRLWTFLLSMFSMNEYIYLTPFFTNEYIYMYMYILMVWSCYHRCPCCGAFDQPCRIQAQRGEGPGRQVRLLSNTEE